MLTPHPRELEIYRNRNGREPFTEWLKSIKDQKARNRIQARLDRLEAGHFGDCQPVSDGVFELRLHFGPGYRIYFGEVDNVIILLLCGGDKSSQARDIKRALKYWQEYQESQQ
ncbi:type II toxin-antitoxin system RelE/ParE family toxin [Candidatus Poribacteria bacterium]|nr:type II toxin-antitoxin system RelE/ParE family toxin [Candidatus Poribacteria bacterium]